MLNSTVENTDKENRGQKEDFMKKLLLTIMLVCLALPDFAHNFGESAVKI
jgi:hypothetical protein